jgi:hypothetical protein
MGTIKTKQWCCSKHLLEVFFEEMPPAFLCFETSLNCAAVSTDAAISMIAFSNDCFCSIIILLDFDDSIAPLAVGIAMESAFESQKTFGKSLMPCVPEIVVGASGQDDVELAESLFDLAFFLSGIVCDVG